MKKQPANRIQPIEKPWIYEKNIKSMAFFTPLKTDPLRGFWYADDGVGPAYHQAGMVSVPPTVQTPFSKRSLLTPGILILWQSYFRLYRFQCSKFQSPPWYKLLFFLKKESISSGDFGNAPSSPRYSKYPRQRRLSPLTGILVTHPCLSVPAPRLGSQAIFSNLRLFWPFSLTRVKNKIEAVSFIRLVMPFFAVLKIFKPTGFLALKTVFQRSVVLWLISSIRFSSFVVKRPPGKGVPLNFSNIPLIWP